ncbi:MAG: glycosyltransferase [Candidatus Margulisbacteria bacterium]|nr:glycosyltransferase [Candidatus Margulisiibacteriota bacterium]
MRIALFSNSYLPYLSGITVSVKMLKDELCALGHEVFIVGPKYPGYKEADPQILRLPSMPATYPGYRLVWPYSYKIFKQLRQEKIDLIHAHQPFGVGLAALILARRMKVPIVYSFHTLFSRYVHHAPFIPQRLAKIAIARYLAWFCNRVDTVIVPSEMVRRLLLLRKVKTPIKVIPTGLKLDLIKQKAELGTQSLELRKKHRLTEKAKILLCSGRLAPEKNIPFLLHAFEAVKAEVPEAYLIMVGGGPREKEYRKLAGNQVIFTGQIPHAEVIDHCLAADLFVYASTTETQGLVLTEAKACGLPVVALFGGGLADVVENGLDGYLVRRDQKKFIEHVVRLLKQDGLRRTMAQKAREDAHERFSSVSVAKRIETVYNSLIQSFDKLRI